MLTRLRKPFRLKAAITIAALYALCVLAPNVALAFGEGTAHCLTEGTAAHVHQARAEAPAHVHADGTTHHHGDAIAHDDHGSVPHKHSDSDGKNHSGTCCGLFCISAMPAAPVASLPAPPKAASHGFGHVYELAGRGPTRINRPPIG